MDILSRITFITILFISFIHHSDAGSPLTEDLIRNPNQPTEFSIRINNMIQRCSQNNFHPSIEAFVFNMWRQKVCYLRLPISNYLQEYNVLLRAARACSTVCPNLTLMFGTITCQDEQVLPDSISVNYRCSEKWPNELTLEYNVTTPTTTLRTSYQPADKRYTYYTLEGYKTSTHIGYLTIDISSIQCSNRYYAIVDHLTADYNETVFCNSALFSIPQIQQQLHTSPQPVLVPQSYCGTPLFNNVRAQHIKLIYHCSNQITTTPDITSSHTSTQTYASTLTDREKTTTANEQTLDHQNMKQTTTMRETSGNLPMYTLEIILGVTIPLIIVLLAITIVICLHRKRKGLGNPLISQQTYQAAHDDIYDGSIAGGSSVAMYQDPCNILQGRIRRDLSFQGSLGSGVYSICHDPSINLAVATGPPGTPSPIRDAVRQSLDYSADFLPSRTPPDGMADSSSSSTHVYDNPLPVTDTPPVPNSRTSTVLSSSTNSSNQNSENSQSTNKNTSYNQSTNNNSDNRLSVPGSSHLEGAVEHQNASIRRCKIVTDEAIYHELERPTL